MCKFHALPAGSPIHPLKKLVERGKMDAERTSTLFSRGGRGGREGESESVCSHSHSTSIIFRPSICWKVEAALLVR